MLKKSRFTEFIVSENSLNASGFQEWFFYPGMRFNEMDKWWGNGGERNKPHEGVDLCFFKTHKNEILQLNDTIKIPVLYDGVVVKVMDDYIGRSIVVEHPFDEKDHPKLYTIYGHTLPNYELYDGKRVREGEILATLARPKASSPIPPHLHLSIGWLKENHSIQNLDWETIGATNALKWVDPLKVI